MIKLLEYTPPAGINTVYDLNIIGPRNIKVNLSKAIKIANNRFLVHVHNENAPWEQYLYDYSVGSNTYTLIDQIGYAGFEFYPFGSQQIIVAYIGFCRPSRYSIYDIYSNSYRTYNLYEDKPWASIYKSYKTNNDYLVLAINSYDPTKNSFIDVIDPRDATRKNTFDIGVQRPISTIAALSDTLLIYFLLEDVKGNGILYFVDTNNNTKTLVQFNPGDMLYSRSNWIIPIHQGLIIYVQQVKNNNTNTINLLTGAFGSSSIKLRLSIPYLDKPSVFLDKTSIILADNSKQVVVVEDFVNQLGTSKVNRYTINTSITDLTPFYLTTL